MIVALQAQVFLLLGQSQKDEYQACCPEVPFGNPMTYEDAGGTLWIVMGHPSITEEQCVALAGVAVGHGFSVPGEAWFGAVLPEGWVPYYPPMDLPPEEEPLNP